MKDKMEETKILKARCKRTDRRFALELKKYGSDWKVTNMDTLPADVYESVSSEVRQPAFYTHDALLPCLTCGSRKVGGCRCSVSRHACSKGMKYQFDCVYCDQFEIDYKRGRGGPYNAHAGISNIPGAIKDSYGNPQGSEYDLAADGSFKGYKIVVLCTLTVVTMDHVFAALRKKGFEVEWLRTAPTPAELKKSLKTASQLWVISTQGGYITDELLAVIRDFYNNGHGLYVWGDNDPLNWDANFIISHLFSSHMSGDYMADKILSIQAGPGMPGIVENHLISTGIVSFYEGVTIAHIQLTQYLMPLVYSSDGNIVTVYYDHDGRRAMIDGAFTRLWDQCWKDTAGTERYLVNAACWLVNVERFGYDGD